MRRRSVASCVVDDYRASRKVGRESFEHDPEVTAEVVAEGTASAGSVTEIVVSGGVTNRKSFNVELTRLEQPEILFAVAREANGGGDGDNRLWNDGRDKSRGRHALGYRDVPFRMLV